MRELSSLFFSTVKWEGRRPQPADNWSLPGGSCFRLTPTHTHTSPVSATLTHRCLPSQASNSASYIQDAFQLLRPILEISHIQRRSESTEQWPAVSASGPFPLQPTLSSLPWWRDSWRKLFKNPLRQLLLPPGFQLGDKINFTPGRRRVFFVSVNFFRCCCCDDKAPVHEFMKSGLETLHSQLWGSVLNKDPSNVNFASKNNLKETNRKEKCVSQ